MPASLKEMTLDAVQDIIGRAIIDSDFRNALLKDPETTIKILGFNQSATSVLFFQTLNSDSFKELTEEVENRLGGRPVIAAWL
jgi:hypothetical protein